MGQGPASIHPIGFGCMGLVGWYGQRDDDEARATLLAAVEAGVDHYDTAASYQLGENEKFVGSVLAPFRQKLFEGADHGIARTAQLFSQNSAGGKTCARRKSALEHRKAHLVVDLAVERRCLRATVQSEREERGGGSPAQHERLWLLLWLP